MNHKKALFLCSGREDSSERMLLTSLLEDLLEQGYSVDSCAPQEFELHPAVEQISWRLAVEFPGLRWLHRTFVFPLVVIQYCIARRYALIVSTDPYLLFVSWFATFLIDAKRLLLLTDAPWRRSKRKSRYFLTRFVLGFQDFLGMLSSTYIVVPLAEAKRQIGSIASLLEKKVVYQAVAKSCLREEERTEDAEYREERLELLGRYDLPDKAKVFTALLSECSFEQAHYFLRVFAVFASSKQALFLLGENQEQSSLMSIAVGLGLVEQVFFIEAASEAARVSRHSNYCILLDDSDCSSFWVTSARAHRAVVISLDSAIDSTFSDPLRFEGNVARDAAVLKDFFSDKEEVARLREIQADEESWSQVHWGQAVRSVVGY